MFFNNNFICFVEAKVSNHFIYLSSINLLILLNPYFYVFNLIFYLFINSLLIFPHLFIYLLVISNLFEDLIFLYALSLMLIGFFYFFIFSFYLSIQKEYSMKLLSFELVQLTYSKFFTIIFKVYHKNPKVFHYYQ